MKSKTSSIILIGIIALGFFLRVHGINYYSYGDEAYHVYNAVAIGSGQLPTNFHPVALSIFYALFYAVGWIFGIFSSPIAFVETYFAHQHVFYYTGRLFDAIMGTLCLPMVYLLGKRMFSLRTGLVAAFFLAVFPGAVAISQIARGQALCLFLILLSLDFAYRCRERRKPLYYLVSGLAFGAAVSIRLPAAAVLIPIIFFQYRAAEDEDLRSRGVVRHLARGFICLLSRSGLWIFLFGATAIFAASYPEMILRLPDYLKAHTAGISGTGIYIGSEVENGWRYYLLEGFPEALSWPLYILFLAGFLLSLLKIKKTGYGILALYSLLYFLVMGRATIAASRYLFLIFPVCAIFAAEFLVSGGGLFGKRRNMFGIALVVAVSLLAFPALVRVVRQNRDNLKTSTKNLAEEWIFKNLPSGTRIAVESMGYTGPDLKLTPVIDYWIYNLGSEALEELLAERLALGQPSFALKYFIENPPEPKFYTTTISIREVVDIERLLGEGYRYIVTVSAARELYELPYVRERYPEFHQARKNYYKWLGRNAEVIKEFSPGPEHPGSEIKIYRLPGERDE